jgi:AraC-like DNA-binding protein
MGSSTRGNRRILTDAQVENILAWYEGYRALRVRWCAVKTQKQLAAELGVAPRTIQHLVDRGPDYRPPGPMDRSRGRRPQIRDQATRALVHAWHAETVALRDLLKCAGTIQAVANEFGVSPATIQRIITTKGTYKQVSPEKLRQEIARHRRHLANLRERNLI